MKGIVKVVTYCVVQGYNLNMTTNSSKIGIVSLGCPKALVDSERILSKLRAEGYELSGEYNGADLVGCFKYEPVKGALANEIEDIVPEEVKDERWHRFMEWQRRISVKRMMSKVGRTIEVIIDDVDDKGAMGRSHWDAPEIDGRVFLNGDTKLALGDIIEARVKDADDYDLWAIRTTGG